MKLQYKAAGLMISMGVVILLFITIVYSNLNKQTVLQKELQNIKNLSKEIAHHMDTHLEANIEITRTLSSAPIILDTLLKSNAEYDLFSANERDNEINTLNKRWLETKDIDDPFIQEYLTNPVAEFLKLQQIILPGLYGEIFLTNQYGVMIASTGKLTTLAHAHKYWWVASYHEGAGRVFLDDRGFDTSVEGYVFGVVVPVMNGNKIIGILKSNINLEGPLTGAIQKFELLHPSKIQIVRTKGLIIAEKGEIPLSNSLPENIVQYIKTQKEGAVFVEVNNRKELVAFSPIPLTLGSDEYGFGGKHESIDHIKGNEGEGWHIVISLDETIAIVDANRTTRLIIIAGVILIVLTSFIALILGNWFAKPLIKLSAIAKKIGEGELNTRISLITKDEIGSLAQSINRMAENLAKTLTSRDNLVHEIELRKEAEKKISIQLREKETILKEVHHRIKNNFASIGSLLSLQSQLTSTPEVQTALQDAIGRVTSMQVLYERLLLTDDYNITSVKEYLTNLIKDIINLFPESVDITVEIQIDDFQLNPKRLVPIGIIVNELLTNIMKYAFIGRSSGLIEITVIKNQRKVSLSMQDNGVGLPEGFDISESKSFGLMLVKMLSEQLEGSFSIENSNGTRSTLEFSL